MKITVDIHETVIAELEHMAAAQGRVVSEVVEMALRFFFIQSQKKPQKLPDLPTFNSGGTLVDINDRDALYDAMENS
jgi:hypothetical protein